MDPKKDIFATREGKQDFIISVVVIAIFAIFIYYFVYRASDEVAVNTPRDSHSSQTNVEPLQDGAEPHFSYTSSSTNEATSIQVVDGYESDISSAVVVSDIKKSTPIVSEENSKPILSNNETILLYEAQKRRFDSIADAKRAKKQSIPSIVDKSTEANNAIPTGEIKNASTASKETSDCLVIVGVFKETANKARVITKLTALGHTHSEGILRDNLSYIGVPVNCDDNQKRDKLLSELNKAFGIDSWVKKR